MSRGRLLFLTKGVSVNPASRYRFLQYFPYLRSVGFEVEVLPLFPESYYTTLSSNSKSLRAVKKSLISSFALVRRIVHLVASRKADLVILENQVFPYEQGLLEWLLMKLNSKVVIEFDDAIYLTRFHREKLQRTLKKATMVIVGNETLAEFAKNSTDRVVVVPTVVDMDKYPPVPFSPRKESDPFRVGWIGLPVTMPYLLELHEPLKRLANEFPIELRIISSTSIELEGVPTVFVPWSEEREANEIAKLDVGVMPLPDDEWTRGKCGLKLIQYMAMGRASVASPVGVNKQITIDGETGFLASDPDDWYDKLKMLAANQELKMKMGANARDRAEKQYSLQKWAPKIAEIYDNLINNGNV